MLKKHKMELTVVILKKISCSHARPIKEQFVLIINTEHENINFKIGF